MMTRSLKKQLAMAITIVLAGAAFWVTAAPTISLSHPGKVRVVPNPAERRVDVLINEKPFTAYIYPTTLKKPVLYPLRTAKGTIVTRGFPLEPRKGERVDHPHQVGLWFNHGDVNGLDFWNNSEAISSDRKVRMGTIHHRRVLQARSGADDGELIVEAEWTGMDGGALLLEETRYVFRGSARLRSVDRITTLKALVQRVVFRDNKEGVFGLRVARALEHPADKPEVFTDASGRPTSVPVLDNTGVTGKYESSEGLKGDAVWGTRGRWVMLSGIVEGERVTLAILDHPANPGFPTHWHARGYGLFAANPLGQKVFTNGKSELNLTLEPGQSATFRYRLLIIGGEASRQELEGEYRSFEGETHVVMNLDPSLQVRLRELSTREAGGIEHENTHRGVVGLRVLPRAARRPDGRTAIVPRRRPDV